MDVFSGFKGEAGQCCMWTDNDIERMEESWDYFRVICTKVDKNMIHFIHLTIYTYKVILF